MCVYLYHDTHKTTKIIKQLENMKILVKPQITKEQLKEMVSKMVLDGTLDSIQEYHCASFENLETLESEYSLLSMSVLVDTKKVGDKIELRSVLISDVEIWINEDEEVEVTDSMILFLQNEMTNKVKELI